MSLGIASFLSVNRTVTNLGGGFRHLRLPQMNPFPKLDRQTLPANERGAVVAHPRTRDGAMIIQGGANTLLEVTTDVANPTRGCAVENVKRGSAANAGRRSWAQLLGWRR